MTNTIHISHSLTPTLPLFSPHFNFPYNNLTFSTNFPPIQTPLLCPTRVRPSTTPFFQNYPNIFTSNTDYSGAVLLLFKQLGIAEKESRVVLDKNPDVGLLSIEDIRCRVHGLQSLGLNGLGLSRVITKCPDVLTAKEVDLFIQFVHGSGYVIEPVQIERLLLGTEPRFLASFGGKVELLLEHGVPREKIGHVLNNVNLGKAICLRSCEDIERMLAFLARYNAVNIIAKRPSVMNYDLDTQLVPRIRFLHNLAGGDTLGVGEVLNRLPAIVTYSLEHVQDHVEFLRSYAGLNDPEIFKLVLVFPNVMSTSKERKLRPRIEFLKECGFDSREIYRFLIRAPLFLGLSFEKNLAYKLAILVKIGYAHRTKDLAMAMGAVTRTSSENLQQVISLFLSYGFSCDDIVAMSKKHFQILQYNPKSLGEKMEYLVQDMDREIGELLSFPAFLGYNLEKRIKHRYELKKKVVGEGEEMSLNKLLSVSTANFSRKKKHLVQVGSKSNEVDTTN